MNSTHLRIDHLLIEHHLLPGPLPFLVEENVGQILIAFEVHRVRAGGRVQTFARVRWGQIANWNPWGIASWKIVFIFQASKYFKFCAFLAELVETILSPEKSYEFSNCSRTLCEQSRVLNVCSADELLSVGRQQIFAFLAEDTRHSARRGHLKIEVLSG